MDLASQFPGCPRFAMNVLQSIESRARRDSMSESEQPRSVRTTPTKQICTDRSQVKGQKQESGRLRE